MSTCFPGYAARPETVGISPFWHQSVTIPLAFAVNGRGRPSHFDYLWLRRLCRALIEAAFGLRGLQSAIATCCYYITPKNHLRDRNCGGFSVLRSHDF